MIKTATVLDQMKWQLEQVKAGELDDAIILADHFRTLLDKLYEKDQITIDELNAYDETCRELGLMEGDDDPAEDL